MGEKPHLQKGLYEHYKGGVYEVIDVACNSETLEWYVIYESQERKEKGLPSVWIRPYKVFVETVERDAKVFPRFQKLN